MEFLANCQYVADHLLSHGYEYCVVDYLWFMDLNATASDGSPWTPGEAVSPARPAPQTLRLGPCGARS